MTRAKEEIIGSLGTEFEIRSNIFKPFPTCGANQIGVEITAKLARQNAIRVHDIERINVVLSPRNKCYPGVDSHSPFTTVDKALLSIRFAIAADVKNDDLTADTYVTMPNDAELLQLSEGVTIEAVETMGMIDCWIDFWLKDGKTIGGGTEIVEWDLYQLSRDRAMEKFLRLTATALKPEKAQEVATAILRLPKVRTISELSKRFADS